MYCIQNQGWSIRFAAREAAVREPSTGQMPLGDFEEVLGLECSRVVDDDVEGRHRVHQPLTSLAGRDVGPDTPDIGTGDSLFYRVDGGVGTAL